MKRIAYFLLSLCILLSLESKAQIQDSTIAIPNSSFENWSNGNGYSVSVLFFSLPVYSSFTYPSQWNYPTYPVDQTLSYSGINVNINTDLPLLKISNETTGTVNGSHALKIQSFMLSDIINSTVYNLASSSLDPMMTTSVFPTVLSTGVVNVTQFFPIMYDLTSNFGNFDQLLNILTNTDLSTLIDGGLPLNGLIPGKMTGYYKYTSAASNGDNGGILMLGTQYDATTQRRDVVGVGYTMDLSDISDYIYFELPYQPLCELIPGTPYEEADSLVIFLFSSANPNPQQGSSLYLDNLQLFIRDTPLPTNIQQSANNPMLIYPNPAHGQCVVRFANQLPKTVKLYTIEGALIQEMIPNNETLELNLPSKGIFFICCETEEGTVVRKIVNQ